MKTADYKTNQEIDNDSNSDEVRNQETESHSVGSGDCSLYELSANDLLYNPVCEKAGISLNKLQCVSTE